MRYYREKKEHLWDFYSNLYNSPLPIGAVQLEEGAIDTVTHRKACRSEVRPEFEIRIKAKKTRGLSER